MTLNIPHKAMNTCNNIAIDPQVPTTASNELRESPCSGRLRCAHAHHEPTVNPHCKFSRASPARAFARHRLHGGGGVRLCDHGRAAEGHVAALRTAAGRVPALHFVLAVLAAADRLGWFMGDIAAEKRAAASV